MSPLLTNAELETYGRYFGTAIARMATAEAALAKVVSGGGLVDGDERVAKRIADDFMAQYLAEQKANREIHERQRAAEREGA